jgi:hypothetical protein
MTGKGEVAAAAAVELEQVQGIVLSGYGHMPHAAFLFLQIRDRQKGAEWLRKVLGEILTAAPWPVNANGTKPSLNWATLNGPAARL